MTDEQLAALCRLGDRAAFEALVRRTGRLVFAFLRPDCSDAHEAEDLTQETFLIAFRRMSSLDHPAKFRAWLLAIASSVLVDSRRRNTRRKRDERLTIPIAAVDPPGKSPPDPVENREEQERAMAALRALPAEYRQVLSLRYLADCDHDTIGKQLGLTNGSLRGLLHRGMAMLREKLNSSDKPVSEVPRRPGSAHRDPGLRSTSDTGLDVT